MSQIRVWLKLSLSIMTVIVIWSLLFGVRLIGYAAAISERGFRVTECGTQGCGDFELVLNAAWTLSFFVLIPLVLPLVLVVHFNLRGIKGRER